MNTGNGIEGAIVCTSLGSLLRPLFYFLCSILLSHRVRMLLRVLSETRRVVSGSRNPPLCSRCCALSAVVVKLGARDFLVRLPLIKTAAVAEGKYVQQPHPYPSIHSSVSDSITLGRRPRRINAKYRVTSMVIFYPYTETGLEAIERLHFLASFPPPCTGKREEGKKTQPFNRFASHPVI